MKHVLVGCLLLGMHSACLGQDVTNAAANAKRLLLKAEHDWAKAVVDRNETFLDRILSDDFVGWDYEGNRYTKSDIKHDLNSGELETIALDIDDIAVRVFGNTAVVTSLADRRGRYKGRENAGQFRWLKIYVKKRGQWQVVAQQSTRIAPPKN